MSETTGLFPKFKTETGRAAYFAAYETALAAWPIAYREHDVKTRFGQTHVVECGREAGPPLVLLPSFAATASAWAPNVEALGKHFHVYAVDVIGQPGKSFAERKLKDRADFADWFGDTLDALGLKCVSVVGASFGGFLAVSQAALTPALVDKIVLIGPVGVFAPTPLGIVFSMLTGALRRRVRGFFVKGAPSVGDVLSIRTDRPESNAWRELMSVTLQESPRALAIATPVFAEEELRSVLSPTLLLIGENERLYDARATLEIAQKRLPTLSGAVVPRGDHLAAMSEPEFVNERMIAFFLGDVTGVRVRMSAAGGV